MQAVRSLEILRPEASWRNYAQLVKPNIVALHLLSTLAGMLVASDGTPSLAILFYTLLGGALASGGANAINCYLDSDIDAVMRHSRLRPIPAQRIEPKSALRFGTALCVMALGILMIGVNLLAAGLTLFGILFYVFVYTLWLKRRTTHNIVIGAIAAAVPPLVGWAAVTGGLTIESLLLFGIVFYWTPTYYWSFTLAYQRDYSQAGIPMLTVIQGSAATRRQIVYYSILTVALTFLTSVYGSLNYIYVEMAMLMGAIYIYNGISIIRQPSIQTTWRFHRFSIIYLALIFIGMIADRLIF